MSIPHSLETLLLALSVAVSAGALAADDSAAQRERIARERGEVEQRARAGEAACADAFAVTDCVRRVRAERRTALLLLDNQRAQLDDALRKQRAADRLARIRDNLAAAARAAERPQVEIKTRQKSAPSALLSPDAAVAPVDAPAHESLTPSVARSPAAASAAQAKAEQRASAARQREERAAAHRREVETRNRERAASGKLAPPLPVPGAASATSR
jgi:hypothetical protein